MTEPKPTLKGRLSRWTIQLLGRLPLSVGRLLGGAIGRLSYALNTRLTQTTRLNIQHCFPALNHAEQETLIKHSMIETGRVSTELPQIWVKPFDKIAAHIVGVHQGDLLTRALANDKGLVLLLPHLGNWEIFGPYLARITEFTALYQPPKLAAMESLIRHSREREGARLVPTSNKGVMALFKTLKAGGTTAILPDQVPAPEAGEFAPFFGVPALTMTLVHGLLKRTGSQVLMAYAIRVPGGFEISFAAPDADIYSADLQTSLQAMNRSVEQCVNACPSQYQWEYKRFRKQPDGLPKFYG